MCELDGESMARGAEESGGPGWERGSARALVIWEGANMSVTKNEVCPRSLSLHGLSEVFDKVLSFSPEN